MNTPAQPSHNDSRPTTRDQQRRDRKTLRPAPADFADVVDTVRQTFEAVIEEMSQVKEASGHWPTVGYAFDSLRVQQLGWPHQTHRRGTVTVTLDADTAQAFARMQDLMGAMGGVVFTPSTALEVLMLHSEFWMEAKDAHPDMTDAVIQRCEAEATEWGAQDTGRLQ